MGIPVKNENREPLDSVGDQDTAGTGQLPLRAAPIKA
jgi:hypothetical protein